MTIHATNTKEKNHTGANVINHKPYKGESTFHFFTKTPRAARQEKLQEIFNNSPRAIQLKETQEMVDRSQQVALLLGLQERIYTKNADDAQLKHDEGKAVMQMTRVNQLEESEFSLGQVVESMEGRAKGAAASMLWDFKEQEEGYRYFIATNEMKGNDERYGLMSLKNPPEIKPDEKDYSKNDKIDSSIWVEGVVADAGSGLGGLLLDKAEEIAENEGRRAVALAAFECQEDGGETYSAASYYENKKGYTYSGEAYEEVDGEDSYFYPIY